MAYFEVLYYDEQTGRTDKKTVNASSQTHACDKVERMGEYEVIEIERVNLRDVRGGIY